MKNERNCALKWNTHLVSKTLTIKLFLEGDLEKIVEEAKTKPLTEDQVYKVYSQIVIALIEVHKAGMTHGDLKP